MKKASKFFLCHLLFYCPCLPHFLGNLVAIIWSSYWYRKLASVTLLSRMGCIRAFSCCLHHNFYVEWISGVKELGNHLVKWNVLVKWHLIAYWSPFLLLGIAFFITNLSKEGPVSIAGIGVSREFPKFGIISFLLYNIFSSGYG